MRCQRCYRELKRPSRHKCTPNPARQAMATKIVQLKHELGALGLFQTMHAMEHAVKAIGYELIEYGHVGKDAMRNHKRAASTRRDLIREGRYELPKKGFCNKCAMQLLPTVEHKCPPGARIA